MNVEQVLCVSDMDTGFIRLTYPNGLACFVSKSVSH